jgi:hypothetical protein
VDALSVFQSSPHSRAPSLPREMPEAVPQEAAASSEREPDTTRASSGDGASTSNSSSTFTISPVGATAAGVAVAAAACALAAGGHWRATASALAEEGIDAVTRRKALPTAVRSSLSSVFCLSFCFLGRTRFGSYLFLFPTHSPPPETRTRFLRPHAKKNKARALGVATVACVAATALVGGAASALGFLPQLAGEASVATPAAAAGAAERARAAVRGSMRAMILGEGGGDKK